MYIARARCESQLTVGSSGLNARCARLLFRSSGWLKLDDFNEEFYGMFDRSYPIEESCFPREFHYASHMNRLEKSIK